MLIPLNTKKSCSLCLSVISKKSGSKMVYSVAIMDLINGMGGMYPVPSFRCRDDDEKSFATVVATTDYEVIEDVKLETCIDKCLKQLQATGEL